MECWGNGRQHIFHISTTPTLQYPITPKAVYQELQDAFSQERFVRLLDRLWTDEIVFFPVRHHSPACSWHLTKLIHDVRPVSILVEGPEHFTELLPYILHEETRPPFAVYTQYVQKTAPTTAQNGSGHSGTHPKSEVFRFAAYYPFCDYSPELIALQEGQAVGAKLRFIDLNYADQVLAALQAEDAVYTPRVESLLEERHLQQSRYLQELARRTGCRDVNDLWDHLFEADFQLRPTVDFLRNVAAYCAMARLTTPEDELRKEGIEAREHAMASAIKKELHRVRKTKQPGIILVVTGGFHTVALPDLISKRVKAPKKIKTPSHTNQDVLIRYSFEQLDALNGYASGMPAPRYYQSLWELRDQSAGQALHKIASDMLVELGRLTRREQTQIALSTADEIAALQQARLLAEFRGHPGPMREDLLDGVRSCFVKGGLDAEGALLLGLAHRLLRGQTVGHVPAEAGVPPIVEDFRNKTKTFRLDISDSQRKTTLLDIYRKAGHRKTSRFLHSLIFLNVTFGFLESGPDFVRGDNLERIQERWEYCWTPHTESSLIDRAVYGTTVEEAAVNLLHERIADLEKQGQARDAAIAVNMLISACQMGLHQHVGNLLRTIETHIVEASAFAPVVQAANQLLLLWQAREPLEARELPEVLQLMVSAYLRACYLIPALAQCPDEQVTPALLALNTMRGLLASLPERQTSLPERQTSASESGIDTEIFWEAGQHLIAQSDCHATICGGMAGLLYSEGHLRETILTRMIQGYLGGSGGSWHTKVGFLRGLLQTCREAAWQNRDLIRHVDRLLNGWDEQEFLEVLPDLRLAFADLTPRETDRVAETIAEFHDNQDLGELVTYEISEDTLHWCVRLEKTVQESLKQDRLHTLLRPQN